MPRPAAAVVTHILAVSGSLRARSSNTAILQAVALLAPSDVQVEVVSALDALPHFNPDLDGPGVDAPPSVRELRERVGAAHALLICSPEYAHGVPGTLKNALDWLVSVTDLAGKPVALLNAAPRSWHAQASLAETLRTMAMRVVTEPSIPVPPIDRGSDAAAIARNPELAAPLRQALEALVQAARSEGRSAH